MTNTTTPAPTAGWQPRIINNHLNEKMWAAGIRSIKQLSERSGVTYTLSKRVVAGTAAPSAKVIGKFAAALNCRPEHILGWEPPK